MHILLCIQDNDLEYSNDVILFCLSPQGAGNQVGAAAYGVECDERAKIKREEIAGSFQT